MNSVTTKKIKQMSSQLHKIHSDLATYRFVIPLLDEPYQLALKVLDFDFDDDPHEVVKALGISWQTVKQIRSALQ